MFKAKLHEYSTSLHGDAAAAFDVARTALLSLGFEILRDSDGELRAKGPGMQSNRQPALLGASELHFQINGSTLVVRATLGGVRTMKMFLYLFPPALALSFTIPMAFSGQGSWWACFAWAAPWLLLSPWMAAALERGTSRAVDRLVDGMAGARARAA